tara:strand:- start:21 stop:512 length:492 start_codon:yes stop_codon:yes gene_type:complete
LNADKLILKKPMKNPSIVKVDAYKVFKPELSPKQMLEAGVFGGNYFKNDIKEFPESWFKKAKIDINKFDIELNYFKIKAGLSKEHWLSKGWIFDEDPLGWFQWYCRFTLGRRVKEMDQIQIMRWFNFGPRHIGAIKKNCEKKEYDCRRKQRQALLQWAYNPFF